MKEDQRVTVTKRLLEEGMFRLLKKKDTDQITVTELCSESGINRATFYRHYSKPSDVITEVRRRFSETIRSFAIADHADLNPLKWLEDTCNYLYDNRETLGLLFRSSSDESFIDLINEVVRDTVSEIRERAMHVRDESSIKLAAYYYGGGIYCILRQWLLEPIEKTPEEIAALIHRILTAAV